MDTTPEKKKVKRASKSKRKHIRMIKQTARAENVTEAEVKRRVRAIGAG